MRPVFFAHEVTGERLHKRPRSIVFGRTIAFVKWPTWLTDILVVTGILALPSQLVRAVEWTNANVQRARRYLFPTPHVNVRPLAAYATASGVSPMVST
jgi:hypothetical protein